MVCTVSEGNNITERDGLLHIRHGVLLLLLWVRCCWAAGRGEVANGDEEVAVGCGKWPTVTAMCL